MQNINESSAVFQAKEGDSDDSPIKADDLKALETTESGKGGKLFQSQVQKIKILKGLS